MHSGTLLQDVSSKDPTAALFFNQSPSKLIIACEDDILIVDVSTQSTQPIRDTPKRVSYFPRALALSDDDTLLVAGSYISPYSVCGYDTASLTRLWIHNTVDSIGAVCMLGAHVLVTVYDNPTLVLENKTGAQIAALQKADGCIYGLGVIEGLCFIYFSLGSHPFRPPHLRVPRHASAPPLQASQVSAPAAGDVGLDREVPRVAVIGCCDGQPIIPLRQSQTQSN
jgi:hypothetical protein